MTDFPKITWRMNTGISGFDIDRNIDPEHTPMFLRSEQQQTEGDRIGRIEFKSAGATRKR